jgi:hypothetical protein
MSRQAGGPLHHRRIERQSAAPNEDRRCSDQTERASGIVAGGQLASGAANHALLQWQCVKVRGRVVVMDNVLSISMKDRPSGPITISNVTFA